MILASIQPLTAGLVAVAAVVLMIGWAYFAASFIRPKTSNPRPRRRHLNVLRAKPKCGNCDNWDHEEGQAAMAQFPQFQKAAAIIPPNLMGAKANKDGVKTRHKSIPAKTTWNQLGACMLSDDAGNNHLVYDFDYCPKHKRGALSGWGRR